MLSGKLWFHEDDFQQVQFLPSSCWDFCLYHLDQLRKHDEEHRAPDGAGWTKMYSIPPAPASVADLTIRPGDLAAAMPWRMRRTNRVLTGTWSEEGTRLPRTVAYKRAHCAVVFGWNDDRIVDSLWFRDGYVSWWNLGPLLETFFRMGILAPLMLVDWTGTVVDLRDRKAIRTFLRPSRPANADDDSSAQRRENA